MRRLPFVLLAALLLATSASAELGFWSVSATQTSQTVRFPTPRAGVLLCNYGANEVYYRLFRDDETAAAATSANAVLQAGTATAPVCKGFDRTPTMPAPFGAISIVCATGETATVTVEAE